VNIFRIEVTKHSDAGEHGIAAAAHRLGISSLRSCRKTQLFFLNCPAARPPSKDQIKGLCDSLLVDPVTESAQVISQPHPCPDVDQLHHSDTPNEHVIEVALRPGVTDVAARVLERGAAELGIHDLEAATATQFRLTGDLSPT